MKTGNFGNVDCRVTKMVIPTYPEPEKEKLPMYCENRCHQRTSGRVYPNPIVKEVIRDHKVDQEHTAIILENDFIELIILPEIGGRIFGAKDKTNGYDFFYRQHVIKPALIGLLGSWLSGGAEFNWPMHHRPSTYMPTDFSIENGDDGSVTVWLSEHEPLDRMKGMVGIRLCPGKAIFETVARVFNRTELPQSFLWWENIAVPVNEDYQIFFPQDVNHVHFHRKQSVTEYPLTSSGMFNGKDYREGTRDIRWHKSTRDATSYFSANSHYDFFGGFDHGKNAGVVHVANHHISPGKKMFTWAYDQLSKSWENALTDADGAYAELMAGVYTDNQPDFAWLEVGEVKQFSQFWYPIKDLGEPLNANTRAAFNFSCSDGELKIYATEELPQSMVEISEHGQIVYKDKLDLTAGTTTCLQIDELKKCSDETVRVIISDRAGKEIISFSRTDLKPPVIPEPRPADPSPYTLDNPDELYLVGLHMKQYRDPLTKPDVYWKRAIELNPQHFKSLDGLGLSALKDFKLDQAEEYFKRSIAIQTKYNPNPRDGEGYYNLGLTLKMQGRVDEAYDAFYKSTWNYRWRSPGFYAIATIDCLNSDFPKAKDHLLQALDAYAGNQKARNLLAVVERKLGNDPSTILEETLRLDPVDYWALNETGQEYFDIMLSDPSQTILDIAFEYTGAGLFEDAAAMLQNFVDHFDKVSPMVLYTLAWSMEKTGKDAENIYVQAREACQDYCFPSRFEEMQILEHAIDTFNDSRAAYYLGNLLYGKEHYEAAIKQWEKALADGENYYVLLRNLGMGYYNNQRDFPKALDMMKRALELAPEDAQLVFDYNHLLQLTNSPVEERLELLGRNPEMVERRDDLYLELVRAFNQAGDCEKALNLLASHVFTPCEGGEHALIEQHTFAHFKLGRKAMEEGDYETALKHFRDGQFYPENLGAGVWNVAMKVPSKYYEGECLEHIAPEQAQAAYKFIDELGLDLFTYMYVPGMDYYRALAMRKLGRDEEAEALLKELVTTSQAKLEEKDYGYFSITPFFLSLLEKPCDARSQHFNYLLGLGHAGLGETEAAKACFDKVLTLNSGHLMADLEKSSL